MLSRTIQITFLLIFAATAVITLWGIVKKPPFDNIDPFYLRGLFGALILELIAVVILAGKDAFRSASSKMVEHYEWRIAYPSDLRQSFEKAFLADPAFRAFY